MQKTINTCEYKKLNSNNTYYKITNFKNNILWFYHLFLTITQDD